MIVHAFNPEVAVIDIPFADQFKRADKSERLVRFGQADDAVTFEIDSVSDIRTGRELPTDAFRLKDQGADGEHHRQVLLSFDGDGFTKLFQDETEPEAFVARLKGGLYELQRRLPDKDSIGKLSLREVSDIYNSAHETLVGTYEPLFAALTSGSATLAIRAIVPEIKVEGSEPAVVTLYIQPHPVITAG